MEMRGRSKEDVAGEYKAVFELAAAMRDQIKNPSLDTLPTAQHPAKEEGDDISAFTEAKLRRCITKGLRGGSISYTNPLLPTGDSGHEWNTRAWIRSHKLSISAMVVCVMVTVYGAFDTSRITYFLFPLPVELILALYIGSTRKSHIVLFFWGFLLTTALIFTAVSLP